MEQQAVYSGADVVTIQDRYQQIILEAPDLFSAAHHLAVLCNQKDSEIFKLKMGSEVDRELIESLNKENRRLNQLLNPGRYPHD